MATNNNKTVWNLQSEGKIYSELQVKQLYNMNLNNLTPWETQNKPKKQETQRKQDKYKDKSQKRVSASLTSSKIPLHCTIQIKVPTLLNFDTETREPLIAVKRRRLPVLDDNRKRVSQEWGVSVPVNKKQFITSTKTMAESVGVEESLLKTRMQCPQIEYLSSLLEQERRCIRLKMMPKLKVKMNRKHNSTSQHTLRSGQYLDYYKIKSNSVFKKGQNYEDLMENKQIRTQSNNNGKLKQQQLGQPFQSIRTIKFDSSQYRKSPVKAYSKLRVDHFFQKFLQKMD